MKVVSPYGEIPWNELSRLSDREMKELMIDVVDRCNDFLTVMFCTGKIDEAIEALKQGDPVPQRTTCYWIIRERLRERQGNNRDIAR